MIRSRILIIDKMHPGIVNALEEKQFIVHYRPDIKPQEVYDIIKDYHGLVVRSKLHVDEVLLNQAVQLRFVARAGAGIDNIDYPKLSSRGILLINAPEGNRDALGEQTVGMLLSLLHQINKANKEVKSGVWDREGNRGWELKDKTVGIYGYGHMGSAFAEKLRGFGCRVLVFDKYKTNLSNEYVEQVDLAVFTKEVEILSIHIPLTSETRFLFDEDYFSQFGKLKFVLNTSRGETLSLDALVKRLEDGSILGAGLDVLENEKINSLSDQQEQAFKKLCAMDQVILTPHVAGWTFESYERINEVIISKLGDAGLVEVH